MKKFIFWFAAMLVFMASCEKTNVVSDELLVNGDDEILSKCIENFNNFQPFSDLNSKARKSAENAVAKDIVFYDSSGIFYVQPNPGDCSDFMPPLQMVIEGGGIATHIGRFDVKNLACVDVDGNFLSPVYGYITASNGDVIYTQMGAPYPDLDNLPNFYYPYTVIGGSIGGRFEYASGSITMYGIVDYVTGEWHLSGEGQIVY